MQTATLEGFRLSLQQKHLWLLQQSQQQQPYRAQCAILIEGNLNPGILKKSLEAVVKQHEILRTTFHYLPGMDIPIQVITDGKISWLPDRDFSGESSEKQTVKTEQAFRDLINLPFDFGKGTLLYASLITLSPEKSLLLMSLSAMLADTASLKNLVRELNCAYTTCLNNENSESESLQYADIAEWQNELLEGEETQIGREYWQKQNIASFLNFSLPGERQSEFQSGFQPQSLSLTIPQEWVAKIKAQTNEQAVNGYLSTFLLTCWQILLWRLTSQSNIVMGIGVDGRSYQELESAVGLFVKYLPLHAQLEGDKPFTEGLQQINQSLKEICKWQESFTWESIVDSKDTPVNLFFYSFCFDFELAPDKYTAAGLSWTIEQHYVYVERFKVKLSFSQTEDFLRGELHYDSSLFSREDIQRLADQFLTLLQSILTQPEARISELDILSEPALHQLLVEFNQPQFQLPSPQPEIPQCIHQLFEAQVERTPDGVAVVFENQQLTYRQLNEKANQLAHHLQQQGIKPEVLVGLCVERSVEMLMGILGILKAGGAYLPLDPTYPPERLSFILSDSQVPVLLTQLRLLPKLPEHQAHVICIDLEAKDQSFSLLTPNASLPTSQAVQLENLAYVIYTSGSTGKPKGTLISHRGLSNYLSWCTQAYTVADGCGAPVNSSISFDATITSLFSPLLVGKTVVLLPEADEIEALSTLLRSRSNFSLVKITPAHLEILNQLIPSEEAADQTSALIIGGEALFANSLTFWQTHAPNTRLINEYGPTETVVGCCVYEVPPHTSSAGTVLIGRPIANTQIYLLDQHLKPVPIGVPGELYIGGAGVARGYLNRPDLTAQKFIPNPFSQKPGSRLYKTGDLARYRPDGNLEYIGRIDHQVKIRGFRIELGEIEAVLSQHPKIHSVAVIAREDDPNNKRLVAYIIPQTKAGNPSTAELRSFVQAKLPRIHDSSEFITLAEFPLTPNGKIDRQALPAPDSLNSEIYVPPRTPAEEIVVGIWQQVLGLNQVGIHHNFFNLGGHSLLATQVISRLRQAFQVELPLRSLFEAPTVESMVNLIAHRWGDREIVEEIARTLQELEQLSADEIQTLLSTPNN